jgi:hypothetical protein
LTQDVKNIIAERDAYANLLIEHKAGPEFRAQQLQQFGDNAYNQMGIVAVGDDQGQRFMSAINESREDNINHSMRAAHLEHGDDFVDAFNALQDTQNPALVQAITSQRDAH